MAKYSSEQISLLNQQAGSTPQMAAPTGNVLGDIANLASVGLDIYSKKQAEEKLALAQQQQQAYDSKLAKTINQYNQLKTELIANEVSGVDMNRRLTAFLQGIKDPVFRREVESLSRKESGLSRTEAIKLGQGYESQRETEKRLREEREREEAEALRIQQENEVQKNIKVAESGVAAGLDVSNVENLTDQEKNYYLVQGAIAQAETQKTKSEFAALIQQGTWNEMETDRKTEAFISATLPDFVANVSTNVNSFVGSFKEITPDNLEDLYGTLNQMRSNIPQMVAEMQQRAQAAGAVLGVEQIRSFTSQAEDVLDSWEDILADDAYVKALNNIPDKVMMQTLIKGMSDPKTKGAATNVLIKIASGESMSMEDVSYSIKTISQAGLGSLNFGDNLEDNQNKVNAVAGSLNVNVENLSEEEKDVNFQKTLSLLDTSRRDEERVVAAGALPELSFQIASTEGQIYNQGQKEQVGQLVYEKNAKYLSGAIAAAINSEKSEIVVEVGYGQRDVKKEATIEDFTLDEETLQLVPINKNNYRVVPSEAVNQYNDYITNTLKALEVTGQSTKQFKEDVRKSILVQFSTGN